MLDRGMGHFVVVCTNQLWKGICDYYCFMLALDKLNHLQMSSAAGKVPAPGQAIYSASKHALNGYFASAFWGTKIWHISWYCNLKLYQLAKFSALELHNYEKYSFITLFPCCHAMFVICCSCVQKALRSLLSALDQLKHHNLLLQHLQYKGILLRLSLVSLI